MEWKREESRSPTPDGTGVARIVSYLFALAFASVRERLENVILVTNSAFLSFPSLSFFFSFFVLFHSASSCSSSSSCASSSPTAATAAAAPSWAAYQYLYRFAFDKIFAKRTRDVEKTSSTSSIRCYSSNERRHLRGISVSKNRSDGERKREEKGRKLDRFDELRSWQRSFYEKNWRPFFIWHLDSASIEFDTCVLIESCIHINILEMQLLTLIFIFSERVRR